MNEDNNAREGTGVHVVTSDCKDGDYAKRCMEALAKYGRPDARAFRCVSYEFGIREGTASTVSIIERWRTWADLDALLTEKVAPALPMYNRLLKTPFDPSRDTLRIKLSTL